MILGFKACYLYFKLLFRSSNTGLVDVTQIIWEEKQIYCWENSVFAVEIKLNDCTSFFFPFWNISNQNTTVTKGLLCIE